MLSDPEALADGNCDENSDDVGQGVGLLVTWSNPNLGASVVMHGTSHASVKQVLRTICSHSTVSPTVVRWLSTGRYPTPAAQLVLTLHIFDPAQSHT